MPATDRPLRSVLRAALVAAAVLAAAEIAASAWQPQLGSAAEDGLLRNPHYARGWPEYTRPPTAGAAPRTEQLVIAISNSQGFLRERADAREAWPHRLEEELASDGTKARVMNWSVPGGSSPEMVVLAARARAHQPDLILLVSYNDNFAGGWRRRPLSYGYSDTHHLVYLSEVRDRIPSSFLLSTLAAEPLAWLGAHSALLWHRNRWGDVGERWSWKVAEPPTAARIRTAGTGVVRAADRFTLLDDFLVTAGAGERGGPAVFVVGMPLCGSVFKNREVASAFAASAAEKAAILVRTRAADATAVVPDEEFYGARHMRPEGHARFAAWLAPQVRALLAAGE